MVNLTRMSSKRQKLPREGAGRGLVRVLRALSLFSGIGGLDLAAEMAGIEVSAFCEIEPFPVEVLAKRFPGVPIFDDVRKLKRGDIDESIDIIHGGFPCQDLSTAGKRRGLAGERSGLWFEMLRVISEFRPRYVVAENVRGAVNLALDTVYAGLEDEGYEVRPHVIPASAVGAPHQRERLFVFGVRADVHRRYTEAMTNPGCELRQGSELGGTHEVEAGGMNDDKPERSEGILWPTPVASEGSVGEIVSSDSVYIQNANGSFKKINRNGKEWNVGLANLVRLLAMPASADTWSGAELLEANGGRLNPDWVEQLMNFPEGWTDVDCDEPKPWQGWPALLGQEQYSYEYPRTTTDNKDRAKRLKALGNAVVPAQAYPFFRAIAEIERSITNDY